MGSMGFIMIMNMIVVIITLIMIIVIILKTLFNNFDEHVALWFTN